MPTTYYIDPEADTIITLSNPEDGTVHEDPPNRAKSARSQRPRKSQRVATACKASANDDAAAQAKSNLDDSSYEYRVSSRTLKLASPWFKRVLNRGDWAESTRDEADGRYHIKAEDWDPEAFLIVLNVCHLRNKDVPKILTLEMLANVALIADYYDLHEALEAYTAMWSREAPEATTTDEASLWIWISWTFRWADQFAHNTHLAIMNGIGPSMETLDLPIPERVVG